MGYKDLFDDAIFKRGMGYYSDNRVHHVKMDGHVLTGEVDGTKKYHCKITFDASGEVKKMSCDCPYGENGTPCKHEAALLLKFTYGDLPFLADGDEFDDFVVQVNEGTKNAFLAQLFRNDPRQLEAFKRFAHIALDEQDLMQMIAYMEGIVERNTVKGFIDYYAMPDFDEEMNSVFEDIHNCMEENRKHAFRLILATFDALLNVECDDSDGRLGMMLSRLGDYLGILLSDASQEELDIYYDKIMSLVKDPRCDDQEYLLNALTKVTVKEYVDRFNDAIENLMDDDDGFRDYTHFLIESHINNHAPIEQVLTEYHSLHPMCKRDMAKRVFNYLLDCEEYDLFEKEVKQLLKEMPDRDNTEYVEMLKDFYKNIGHDQAYFKTLEELFFKHPYNKDYYHEYKNVIGDDWDQKRNDIFNRIPESIGKKNIYFEEGMYDQLMSCLENFGSISDLEEYMDVLKDQYSDRLITAMAKDIDEMALRTSNRYTYRSIAYHMNRMLAIDGAKDTVISLLSKFRSKYRNRRAMQDELKAVEIALSEQA